MASSADSSIEPAVGASAYVIGDQVCNGQIGDFTAKAIAKAMNSQTDDAVAHRRARERAVGEREGSPGLVLVHEAEVQDADEQER